jgi:hypothetical protein
MKEEEEEDDDDDDFIRQCNNLIFDILIYLLTAIGLTPGGSSTVHVYTQTVHRIRRTEHT